MYERFCSDKEYRREVKDKFILFVNYRFYGIIDKPDDCYSVTEKNDHRLIFHLLTMFH